MAGNKPRHHLPVREKFIDKAEIGYSGPFLWALSGHKALRNPHMTEMAEKQLKLSTFALRKTGEKYQS